MAVKINFDTANTPESPTFVLAQRGGNKLGAIVAHNIITKDDMKNPFEVSFTVHKDLNHLWDKITDFRLIWCEEYKLWLEITSSIDDDDQLTKSVMCKQLAQAELSQIMLYNIAINTEEDMARDAYDEKLPTIFYRSDHPEASILHRVLSKAPHYSIKHVDASLANIKDLKVFTFDGVSIYDALQQIAEEMNCLFVFHSGTNDDGTIQREISVYDLESSCNECGYRGEFTGACPEPECKSNDIYEGYGIDTTIFVTSDTLGDNIHFETDTNAVKNCFKLEGGDALMTDTIRNCNSNGSDYIWYIPEYQKEDMSDELTAKLEEYSEKYNEHQTKNIEIDSEFESLIADYNQLVDDYKEYNEDLQPITLPIAGYPKLMNAYYNTIDLELFLESSLMPDASMEETSAEKQAGLLITENLSPVAVENLDSLSPASANSVVLSMAKTVIDSRYRVKVANTSLSTDEASGIHTWTGSFIVTNYSDKEETFTTDLISVEINNDYKIFVEHKLDKTIKDSETEEFGISGLFKKDYEAFCLELAKYSLNRLTSFYDACSKCIEILTEQGIDNGETWADKNPNMYEEVYIPFLNKLHALEVEMFKRQAEINIVAGVWETYKDSAGNEYEEMLAPGVQTYIDNIKNEIQSKLDFEKFLGEDLWFEFCSYRREDKYSNENYISDGKTNSELFESALEFIKRAEKEIYKSAELQHSITSTLKNLLVMDEFKTLSENFAVGNWIRVQVDDEVYKLRLLNYEIKYDDLSSLSVEFSDVLKTADGISDQQSIMSKVVSMASSYNSVRRQANSATKTEEVVQGWQEKGLDVTNTKIVSDPNNQEQVWDKDGFICRKYDPVTETYSDEQLKILHNNISITTDNWETLKTAIGKYYYEDSDGNLKMAYGINGETIVGKFILGEELTMQNESGNMVFDKKGLSIESTSDDGSSTGTMTFNEDGLIVRHGDNVVTISPKSEEVMNITNGEDEVFEVDENGELSINGNIIARSLRLENGVTIDSGVITNLATIATSGSYNDLLDAPTKLSNFENDEAFITKEVNDLTNYYKKTETDTLLNSKADVDDIPMIAPSVSSSGTTPVSGKAVYDYALNKNQGSENAGKLLYVDEDGNITSLNIDELKVLLGI